MMSAPQLLRRAILDVCDDLAALERVVRRVGQRYEGLPAPPARRRPRARSPWSPPADHRPGDLYRAGRRVWSAEDDAVLRRDYPERATHELATDLRRPISSVHGRAGKLGVKKSAAYLSQLGASKLLVSGARYRFPKGNVPANKGLRRPGWAVGRMKETQFKAGQKGSNWVPIGSTRIIDGYQYTKVRDIRSTKGGAGFVPYTVNWKPTHHLIWKRAKGPIPRGHALVFRNGDRTDIRLDNLELLSRRELMSRNTIHNLPPELKNTILLLGVLNRKIRRRTRDAEQDRRPAQPPLRDTRGAQGSREAYGSRACAGRG